MRWVKRELGKYCLDLLLTSFELYKNQILIEHNYLFTLNVI